MVVGDGTESDTLVFQWLLPGQPVPFLGFKEADYEPQLLRSPCETRGMPGHKPSDVGPGTFGVQYKNLDKHQIFPRVSQWIFVYKNIKKSEK